jgi:hypothetical protein
MPGHTRSHQMRNQRTMNRNRNRGMRSYPHGGPHGRNTRRPTVAGVGSHSHPIDAAAMANAAQLGTRMHYHPDLGQSQFDTAEASAQYNQIASAGYEVYNVNLPVAGRHMHRRGGRVRKMPHGGPHNGNGRMRTRGRRFGSARRPGGNGIITSYQYGVPPHDPYPPLPRTPRTRMPHGGPHNGNGRGGVFCPSGNYGFDEYGKQVCV